MSPDVTPDPKAATVRAGRKRRYRRYVAGAKQWQALHATKAGPCRVCGDPGSNGAVHSRIHLHHLVTREDGGDDYADNLVPLCPQDHDLVTRGDRGACLVLMLALTDAEHAYMVKRGGENYAERAYGIAAPA